jgi:hypothetical protein
VGVPVTADAPALDDMSLQPVLTDRLRYFLPADWPSMPLTGAVFRPGKCSFSIGGETFHAMKAARIE